MEVFAVRHTSVSVPEGICYGQSDVDVSDSFFREASAVREHLAGSEFDAVYTSPLRRARKLAVFCGFGKAIPERRLMETSYGDWEMHSFEELGPQLDSWFNDWVNVRPPHGESFSDMYARVSEFLDELKETDSERVALFTHGGVLLCMSIYAGLYTVGTLKNAHYGYGHILKVNI